MDMVRRRAEVLDDETRNAADDDRICDGNSSNKAILLAIDFPDITTRGRTGTVRLINTVRMM